MKNDQKNNDWEWEPVCGTSHIVSLGGKFKPYSKCIDPERWFMTKEIYQMLDSFRRMVYHECMRDFLEDDPARLVTYRITYHIEKLEGGFFESQKDD